MGAQMLISHGWIHEWVCRNGARAYLNTQYKWVSTGVHKFIEARCSFGTLGYGKSTILDMIFNLA